MDQEMSRRREWAVELLHRLDASNRDLEALTQTAREDGRSTMEAFRSENADRVREKQMLHRQRIEDLKTCLTDITQTTNDFHAFREDPDVQRHWSYPFLLAKKGRAANAVLRQLRERIASLVLQNRLLEEEIRRLSDTVQRDALARLKETGAQTAWLAALETRQKLVDDLCLVLASIPDASHCHLDTADPNALCMRLQER